MSFLTLLALAVALAMDAFAVAVATGVVLGAVTRRQAFRLSWHFGLFQAAMPLLGWAAGLSVRGLVESFDHWAAFALLAFIGGKMLWESFGGEERGRETDPTKGVSLVLLSLATSVDALAVGFSLALLNVSVWFPSAVIGAVAAAFTLFGLYLGKAAGTFSGLGRWAERAGGVVLLGIGLRILYSHGVFGP